MNELTEADVGGVAYVDARPVSDPQTEFSATYLDRVLDRVVRMTRTTPIMVLEFHTSTAAAPATLAHGTDYTLISHWGSGPDVVQELLKTSTGRYEVTLSSSLTDLLGNSEPANIRYVEQPHAWSPDGGDNVCAKFQGIVSGNKILLRVESPADTVSDVGNQSGTPIRVVVTVY